MRLLNESINGAIDTIQNEDMSPREIQSFLRDLVLTGPDTVTELTKPILVSPGPFHYLNDRLEECGYDPEQCLKGIFQKDNELSDPFVRIPPGSVRRDRSNVSTPDRSEGLAARINGGSSS